MLYGEWSDSPPPELYDQAAAIFAADERDQVERSHHLAGYEWELALERSRMAPPDAGFASRLRQISQTAARKAASLKDQATDDPGVSWTPVPGSAGMTLSHELRPGGNRPGPRDAWERFDRTVGRLGTAMEGDRVSAVAGALSDLADAARDISDTLDSRS